MRGEVEILNTIRRRFPAPRSGPLVLGIGDDCAIYRPRGSREDLLFTTDMLHEHVHFRRHTHQPEAVGWKALARGLSDIAAMGGEPRCFLISLALAPWTDESWITRFYRGAMRLAMREGVTLAGGDLARARHWSCDVVVCGVVPRAKALRRDGARPGDHIYVSGMLGASALGLRTGKGPAWLRHLKPEPRLSLGRYLRRLGATAAMDLSDGLSLDLRRMALESGVAAAIESPPRFPGATERDALHGGEDYELLFAAPPGKRVPDYFEGLPLTFIGVMRKGRPGTVLLEGKPLAPLAWDHLRS